jgi:putative transposase
VQDIVRREVSRYNNEVGRNSQGARGRSYSKVFADGLSERIVRRPTARQLYLSSLIYSPVSVDRNGQVKVDGWMYGSPTTQAELLPFHGTGKRILLGRDPDDLAAPAIAFDEDGRLICEGIEYVVRGAYDSKDGIHTAARNRKAARDAAAKADLANNYMAEAEFAAALAALDTPEPTKQSKPAKVVGARFGGPLRKAKPVDDVSDDVMANYRRNLDAHLADLKAKGEKLA